MPTYFNHSADHSATISIPRGDYPKLVYAAPPMGSVDIPKEYASPEAIFNKSGGKLRPVEPKNAEDFDREVAAKTRAELVADFANRPGKEIRMIAEHALLDLGEGVKALRPDGRKGKPTIAEAAELLVRLQEAGPEGKDRVQAGLDAARDMGA